MSYPKILFVDASGQLLPTDEEGIPFVVQFKARWSIKLDGSWPGGVAALEGSSYLRLSPTREGNLWEPPKKLSGSKGIDVRSGEITAVLINTDHKIVQDGPKAVLRVKPANISEQQMDNMISDIGIMALTTACCVNRAVPIPLGEQVGIQNLGRQWIAGSGLLTTATALLDLADTVRNVWPELKKRPLKSFIAQPGLVDVERASFTSTTLLQRTINPAKRRIRSIKRTESTSCSENEFLCYVLDKYLQNLANALSRSLDSLVLNDLSDRFVPSRTKRKDEAFENFTRRSRRNIQLANEQSHILKQEIANAISSLQDCQQWAKNARQSQFIKDILTPQTPSLRSLRLTESFTYGLIYSKFVQVKGDALESIQEVSHLIESILQGQVKPTWEIYEIWCLAKLYSGFITYTALKPIAGEAGLFQCLSITKNGSIKVPKEKKFRLTAFINDGVPLEVNLTYEPHLRNIENKPRTPDFIVETIIEGDKKSYCFDAKYRCYEQQGAKTLEEDVIGTAKEKYKQGLGVAASFILHSDADIDYWGEVPFNNFRQQKNIAVTVDESDWIGHEYGAIALVPDRNEDIQLKRIIRLLLQYHSTQLSTTCVTCGYKLAIGRNVCASWKSGMSEGTLVDRVVHSLGKSGSGTGVYCSCPKCGDFWVIQSCFGPNHRLLKFQDCFHEISSKHRGKWMYVCPACGSDPSPEDLQQRKNQ